MHKRTLKYLLIGLLLLLNTSWLTATVKPLSEQAQISMLIGEPFEGEFASAFGHIGLRVIDPAINIDYVLNYGVPHVRSELSNYFRLFQGHLVSELYAVPFPEAIKEYQQRQRQLSELVLNLSYQEKEFFWQSLMAVVQGKQHSYYNLLTHNCTALPLELLEATIRQPLRLPELDGKESYRTLINPYLKSTPWLDFIINLSYGWENEHPVSDRELFCLPDYVQQALLTTNLTDSAGNTYPLVASTTILIPSCTKVFKPSFFTPVHCAWILLTLVMAVSLLEGKNRRLYRLTDVVLFGIAGLAGIYLSYLVFGINQWYTTPTWWILWLHPLHLLGAVWSGAKRFDRLAVYYHIFNLTAVSVMLVGTCFIHEYYHPAYAPLIIILALRSGIRVFNYYNNYFKIHLS
ncbi:hypothetical protein AGMMS50262_02660 [Bacteroidia bacterium]|nr:hypothetical protein AGMMS50262_02660 [Bacteroidia bacterium]